MPRPTPFHARTAALCTSHSWQEWSGCLSANSYDVDHMLEGSVRRDRNRLRVTAQLIRASDDKHLWSETFDGGVEDGSHHRGSAAHDGDVVLVDPAQDHRLQAVE